jgi:hypothetical protein
MFGQIVKVFAFPRVTMRWLVNPIYLSGLTLAITGSVALSSTAQTASVGGGLDCNGWSPISRNVRPMVCTDPHGGSDINGSTTMDGTSGTTNPTYSSIRRGQARQTTWCGV